MIQIREDFRRDGLAACFRADRALLEKFDQVFPFSKINIGYPSICSAEYEKCEDILAGNFTSELCLTGHARDYDIRKLLELSNRCNSGKLSANIWIPVSNEFIKNTIGTQPH